MALRSIRLGDTVRVRVYNTMPVGNVVCTQVYGTYELNIPPGSDFQSRRDYAVDVNGQLKTLRTPYSSIPSGTSPGFSGCATPSDQLAASFVSIEG